jgi:hypothetical protein
MTNRIDLFPIPKAPCNECVEDARHGGNPFGLVWCHHNNFGGVYAADVEQWSIAGPFIDEEHFVKAVSTQ